MLKCFRYQPMPVGKIAALPPCRRILAEGPLDAEVVRQVHVFPARVREIRLLRAWRIPLEELPAEVEGLPDAGSPAAAARWRRLRVGLARGLQCRQNAGRPNRLPQQTAPA